MCRSNVISKTRFSSYQNGNVCPFVCGLVRLILGSCKPDGCIKSLDIENFCSTTLKKKQFSEKSKKKDLKGL